MDLCGVHLPLDDVEDGDVAVPDVISSLSGRGDHDILGLCQGKKTQTDSQGCS